MSEVPVTRYQHRPVCPPAFPPHNLSTHPCGTITLEECGIQCSESLANIANAQYYELEQSQHASQMREEGELDVWSRNFNAVPDAREETAQTLIEAFIPLEINHWDIVPSQMLHPYSYPHPPTALQHSQKQQDYPSSSTAPLARQNSFVPLYSSQPLHDQLYPSSVSSSSETVGLEEHDLKRIRNTAASARFRAKKRLRQQGLERNALERKEKLAALEEKIRQLEAENKWLRGLAIEKYNNKGDIELFKESFRSEQEVLVGDKKEVGRDDKIMTEK